VTTAGFEDVVGAANIRFERIKRRLMGHANNGLGPEVKHGVDAVQAHRAFERAEVLEGTRDDGHLMHITASVEFGLGIDILDEGHDVRARRQQVVDQRGSDHAGGTGHKDAASRKMSRGHTHPVITPFFQTAQGAESCSQAALSCLTSRRVSMHCQNPSCRYAPSWPSPASVSRASCSNTVASPSR